MSDQDDPLVALRAGIDQAIASAAEPARLLRGNFEAFREAGFTEEQALALTRDLYGIILRGEYDQGGDAS